MGLFMWWWTRIPAKLGCLGCLLVPLFFPTTIILTILSRLIHIIGIHSYMTPINDERMCFCGIGNRGTVFHSKE